MTMLDSALRSAAAFVIRFRAQGGIDGEDEIHQGAESVPDPGICQLVPGPAPLRNSDHESASTQAGKVIRKNLAGDPNLVGEVRRITRSLSQA